MSLLDHLVFSVVANLAVLVGVALLRTASPRLVLNVCVAGMLMVLVPWPVIGDWTKSAGVPVGGLVFPLVAETSPGVTLTSKSPPLEWSWSIILAGLWFTVAAAWLCFTFASAARTRSGWRARALPGQPLEALALDRFRTLAGRVEIHRLTGSRTALTTGLWHREIWIGDGISSDSHLTTALNHELCHLAAGDQYVVHVISVLERLLWWNPLIWLLGGLGRRHLEYDCDQRCKRLLGEPAYRRALAEMVLERMPGNRVAGLAIGKPSAVIKRMERLTMTYTTRPVHVLAIAAVGAAIASGSGALAAEPQKPTLIACNDKLPEDVHYRLEIKSTLDTRNEDPHAQIGITLLDELNPDSVEVPEGSGPYVRCVLDLLGVPENEYPEGV